MAIKKKNIDKKFYPIEKILEKRIVNGKVQYLIKWMNYSEKCNSWQPAENIKKINRRKTKRVQKRSVKILSRFEEGWCLVKWTNGKTSTIQLSVKQIYEIIVNGVSTD